MTRWGTVTVSEEHGTRLGLKRWRKKKKKPTKTKTKTASEVCSYASIIGTSAYDNVIIIELFMYENKELASLFGAAEVYNLLHRLYMHFIPIKT